MTESLHLFRLAQLLSHEIPIDQFLVVYTDRYQQGVLYRAIEKSLQNDAEHAVLGHTGFAGSSATTFEEEFDVVAGAQTGVHVRVQHRFVNGVFTAHDRIDAAFDEESSEASEEGAKKHKM